jgi:hypothetical protein
MIFLLNYYFIFFLNISSSILEIDQVKIKGKRKKRTEKHIIV